MKPIARHIISALLALLTTVSAAAQTFYNILAGDASTVCSIAQDTQGLVWLGTERGLMAYDGYRTIAHTDGTHATVRIHSMCIHLGTIWLGTERGLMAYDIHTGRYAPLKDTHLKDVRAVCMQDNRLWIGSAQGLYCHDTKSGRTKAVNHKLHNIYSLLPTGDGLLVGTLDGLWLADTSGKARRIRIGSGRQPLVNALLADRGCVWIGTEGALYRYDGHTMSPVAALEGNSIKSLAIYGGHLYAGTDNGMYIYDKTTASATHALHDSRSPHSIANNIVWVVLADRWGNVWAGTDQGVSAIYRHPFVRYTPLGDIVGSGDGNCLHLITRGTDGMMWLGGTNGLIGYRATRSFMPDNIGQVAWYRQNSDTHRMSHNRVRRVYTDRDGNTIVCTDHGLNIYNPQTRQMRNIIVSDPSRRYSTAWAYDIVDDRRGRYWISSYMGGIFVIDKKRLLHATSATITADRHLIGQLQGIHVWQLALDGKGRIWARMYDRGIDRIDPTTMRVEHIVGKERLVNDICTDREGNVWAAMDGEIRRFGMRQKDNRSIRLSGYEDGGAALLCEAEGDIWALAGNDCCILRRDGTSTRFTLTGMRPLAIGYDRTSHCVLIGGNDAVASIPLGSVAMPRHGQRRAAGIHNATASGTRRDTLIMSGLLIDGQAFVPDEGYPTYLPGLTLTARQNNLTIQLSDMPMAGGQPHVYAYRLEGIDRTWRYMHGQRHEIGYSALPPGAYRLEVREVDGAGQPGREALGYDITILPPWYLSVWAKLVYAIIIIGLIVGVTNFVMMRRRLHEEREARQRIMQESEARSLFFGKLSAQLRRPLGDMLASLLAMLRHEKDAATAQRLEHLRTDVTGMNTLVFDAFDMLPASPDDGCRKTAIDIVSFCRHIADDARTAYGRSAAIEFRTDTSEARIETDVARLQPIMNRLVDFAVKGSKGEGHITIGVATTERNATVSVTIPGMDIKDNELPLLFNRYFDMPGGSARQTGQDDALALVYEYAQQNNAVAKAGCNGNQTSIEMVFDATPSTARAGNGSNTGNSSTHTVPATPDSADTRLLAKATEAVEQHMADSDFNVTKLQETLGIGPKLLYRKLKQMTGKTPVEFIRHIRMQRAAVLLREGRFAVSEVMYMVGFSNSSYFSKMFQKAYGMTPTEFSRKT